MSRAVQVLLDEAEKVRIENLRKLEDYKSQLNSEYYSILKTAQDICPHVETEDNGFENGHNGNWEDRVECKLCGKRMK